MKSFGRWLKYELVKVTCTIAALLSFLGALYAMFFFPNAFRIVGAIGGIVFGIGFLLLKHYYNVKITNMYFLPGGVAAIQGEDEQGKMQPAFKIFKKQKAKMEKERQKNEA